MTKQSFYNELLVWESELEQELELIRNIKKHFEHYPFASTNSLDEPANQSNAIKPKPETPAEPTSAPKAETPRHINGAHFIIKDIVLDIIKNSDVGLTTNEVTVLLNQNQGFKNKYLSSNVWNSLTLLQKEGKIAKLDGQRPITWILANKGEASTVEPVKKKELITVDKIIYANDMQRIKFARELGYKTISEAIDDVGSWEFERQLKKMISN